MGTEISRNEDFKQQYQDQINQQFAFFNAIVETDVLRALGGSRWRIRRAMLDESLLISLAGSIAGIAAGLLVVIAASGS